MSTNHFPTFAAIVAASFQSIAKNTVFEAAVDPDALYARYLAAFPEGTNPVFKANTEHDCGTCRHFIRRVGGVITTTGGETRTVWDQAAKDAPAPYREVAVALRDLVRSAGIRDLFRVGLNEGSFGAQKTRSLDPATQRALTWDHFHTGEIPRQLREALPDTVRGNYRTTVQVFERGLVELSPEAVDTVISLVEAKSLYRGEEHLPALRQFQQAQRAFQAKTQREREIFTWVNAHGPAARFRNTVIGTLVQDLSEGKDLERAVASFEAKVAPQNYKRTTALITPGMVKKAMETIESLGLEPALERRFAVLSDIDVNDVKWVDGAVKPLMRGGIGDALLQHVAATAPKGTEKDLERAENISLDHFMAGVLPELTGLEILFSGEHIGNLVSLTAPVDPAPRQLFRWSNDFAWSYGGNVADSIKERVKKAGGKVTGVLRVSLSWFNFDDLDLHIYEPAGRGMNAARDHIHFASKRGWTGGVLDVDMNAGSGTTRVPVENVIWERQIPDGAYRVVVHNFQLRESSNPGFVIEVENAGKLFHFSFNKGVRNQEGITVCTLHTKNGAIEKITVDDPTVTASNISQECWGLTTETYVKVSAVTLSPNYWGDNAAGNKHVFFIIEGAKNPEPTRGFYNEFLHPRLEEHRKVFEVIADKTKCQPTEGQLSGLGFSSTKKDSFIVRASQGKRQRVFRVHVGV